MMSFPQLLASPEWFPDAIYADRGFFDCYRVSRRLLSESPFLDQRMTTRSSGKEQAAFSYDQLTLLADDARIDEIGFIFHTSFCRSTLMAQALQVDGISFTLKEPSILLSLAESIRHTQAMRDPEKIRVTLSAILRLSTGLVESNEKTIVKPTNFANNLLPYVAETGAKILLMYSDLRSYLISILKYGERGRAFARQLYTRLMIDCDQFRRLEPKQALLHTDLQIATLVWQQQMSLFMEVLDRAEVGQMRTLDSDVFGSYREVTLSDAYKFFSIPVSDAQFAQIISGPVFQQHSKSGRAVDDQTIQNQSEEIAVRYHEELEMTLRWAQSTSFGQIIRKPLPNSLTIQGAT
jgi:hypothetical protein